MLFTIPLLLAYGFKVMRRVKVVALCLILILIIINNFESMLYFYHLQSPIILYNKIDF